MKPTNRKTLKKTPWFSGCNPLRSRPGWYEVRSLYYGDADGYMYWTGGNWFHGHTISYDPTEWRGVSR